jgi:hypothetical protein
MVVEIVILVWMLKLDKANHDMYSKFFAERTRWYAARRQNKKPPEVPGGDVANFVVLSESSEDGEQPTDGLPGDDGGEQ